MALDVFSSHKLIRLSTYAGITEEILDFIFKFEIGNENI